MYYNLLILTVQTLPLSLNSSPGLPKKTYVKPSGHLHLKATYLETYSTILRGLRKSLMRQVRLETKFELLHQPSWRV